jgi:hypothetical protein
VFSGSSFEPLETAVPQQFFATSMYLTPLLRGAFGLEADAPRGALGLAPHLFDQPGVHAVRGVRVGERVLDVTFTVTDTAFVAEVRPVAGPPTPLTLRFSPALAPGSGVRDVRTAGGPVTYRTDGTARDVHVSFDVPVGEAPVRVTVRHTPGWWLESPAVPIERGERSTRLKIVDARVVGGALSLHLEGRAGRRYQLLVHRPDGKVTEETVAVPDGGGDPRDGYAAVTLQLRR